MSTYRDATDAQQRILGDLTWGHAYAEARRRRFRRRVWFAAFCVCALAWFALGVVLHALFFGARP